MANILIIDGVAAVRAMLRTWLETDGHTVADVTNSHEGIAAVEASAPDLIIADVSIATVDGLEFLKAMRARRTKARIIATSAQPAKSGRDDLAIARVLGAVATMRKPFVLKLFKQVVNNALALSGDEHDLGC